VAEFPHRPAAVSRRERRTGFNQGSGGGLPVRAQSRRVPGFQRAALAIALGASLAATGCALPKREPALTVVQSQQVLVLGIPNARFMPADVDQLQQEFVAAAQREIDARRRAGQNGPLPPMKMLAISGGGDDGAFGAGLLVGWTARGDRPTFKGVTGVSTGALTAPFAFLGPEYDPQLREVYTQTTARDIFTPRGKLAAIFQDAMGDTAPLRETVSRLVDDRLVQRIGEEYAKGRLLLIMTSNLDAGQACIWNVGAIAASGKPGARELIIKILMASSAIPAVFPPVMIDLDVGGQHRQEMHVDGGVFAQVFLYPPGIDVAEATGAAGTVGRRRDAYIIRNGRLLSAEADVRRRTLPIAGRAVSMMIANSGVNDMIRIYAVTSRDHVGYHLAYIGDDFTPPYKGPFDQAYMRSLFQYGFDRARAGAEWQDKPPGWGQ
jgi:predicted patatin/cPLA2 family phospholipase